jgi:23S rRNA pseudouridine1911/1915/1917 synthase
VREAEAALPAAAARESPFQPFIVEDDPAYLVVYKPPLMHTVPLRLRKQGRLDEGDAHNTTLLDWCAARFPQVLEPRGANLWEGGMVHRLDYETQGLTLAAKTQAALDWFRAQQEQGFFTKTYGGVCQKAALIPGFPPAPAFTGAPCAVESGFRPFGPGRKAVRPALYQGRPYRTEILSARPCQGRVFFKARIARGFRHQIRCHLAWLGFPLHNDRLYGGALGEGFFFYLAALSLSFKDPRFRRLRTVSAAAAGKPRGIARDGPCRYTGQNIFLNKRGNT